LLQRLVGARGYDRIAGYFCPSIFEIAGEALESASGPVRMVCNSTIQAKDVPTIRAAVQAVRQEWCAGRPEDRVVRGGAEAIERLGRLYQFLVSKKLQVRVLPDTAFGLLHGKAGVITLADGSKTAFLGSVNETASGWRANYELLWEDVSADAVAWVEEEFHHLWTHPAAIPLEMVEFVLHDLQRLVRRVEIQSIEAWVGKDDRTEESAPPAAVFVETPVYRKEVGLWEHQKAFVKLAFDSYREAPGGARLVLADQVGLGKTIQLGMAATLMALSGEKPVLIVVPKTLLWQWQAELRDMLDVPSAVWDGRRWVDENEVIYPDTGPDGIGSCPRRIGIVSGGLVTAKTDAAEILKKLKYECVILDEAHRARRKNLGEGRENESPDPNNLLTFLYEISARTKSLLLATATPVQLHPIEAWDLLDALGRGTDAVLGNTWSRWRNDPREALALAIGNRPSPESDAEKWEWVRNPLPPRSEGKDYAILRKDLGLSDPAIVADGGLIEKLSPAGRKRVRDLFPEHATEHNPFIRHIVRRSREYLEQEKDPATGEPYLQPIGVRLFGEDNRSALLLPAYLREAYDLAEEFCRLLGQRLKGSGFLKTLLLRRVGSTIEAGRRTAERLLGTWEPIDDPEEDVDEFGDMEAAELEERAARTLTATERSLLSRFVAALTANQERDPKYHRVVEVLRDQGWLESRGVIVFSQFYDSVRWLAEQLVEDFPDEPIGIYAGAGRSAIWHRGQARMASREEIKRSVRDGELRLLLGTDAASEGLNLQRLGALVNLDLPWNPTRLEQRKGRIQRIGQVHSEVWVYNMRYFGSVEDRVHELLSERLQSIHALFGQLPDVLEDVWIDVALGELEQAKKRINATPAQHPFDIRYRKVEKVDWESCAQVLSSDAKKRKLTTAWG
jgi:superfamily II DNA or RNA helicase